MDTEEIVLSDEDLEGLSWVKQDDTPYADFEHGGRILRISVQRDGAACKNCDSYYRNTGEFRIRRAAGCCLASKVPTAAKLPEAGCGGISVNLYSNPYKVVQIGLAESSPANSVGPIQPSLF